MTLMPDRRSFLAATGTAMAALAASGCARYVAGAPLAGVPAYGELVPDPAGVLDLPRGFSYRVLSRLGDRMSDGFTVPNAADGMGCFDLGGGKLALVRNHELRANRDGGGVTGIGFDRRGGAAEPLPGGTTTIVLDARTLRVERQYRSLAGTIRNCAGGITPWGSWLTCEEDVSRAGTNGLSQDHGWVFEVPAAAPGLVDPVPLKAMGRFNHEAACVDPATGIVYQTEDREDGLLYRFIPAARGQLQRGGRLQALALADGIADSRNWQGAALTTGQAHPARWVDIDNVESPEDDLRQQGARKGATLFARGEGIHMGEGELYFCCTNGGAARLGQIFRLRPSRSGGMDAMELFFESTSKAQFDYGDNLTIAPNGHLIVCEDQYTETVANRLIGLTPAGTPYPLGFLRLQTELAGACFSPDGRWLFVNAFDPAMTLAITGPWQA